MSLRVAVVPAEPAWVEAVRAGGGEVVEPAEAEALVFGGAPDELAAAALHDGIRWVQLPSAGIESYLATGLIDRRRQWLAARGVYARAVAEWCLAMLLAGFRMLPQRARTTSWGPGYLEATDRLLLGATVGIVGAGGIGLQLIELLRPLGAHVHALTRSGRAVAGAERSLGPEHLDELLEASDAVVLLAPDTPVTRRMIGAPQLARMRPHAWLLNAGRGPLIDTDALVDALRREAIGGAALDVTDPEPLPDGHPLWTLPNAIVTPHVANTAALSVAPMSERIRENVARAVRGEPLLGVIDLDAGY